MRKQQNWAYTVATFSLLWSCVVVSSIRVGNSAFGQEPLAVATPVSPSTVWRDELLEILRRSREKVASFEFEPSGTSLADRTTDLIDKTISEGLRDDLTLLQFAELIQDAATLLHASSSAEALNVQIDPAVLELLRAAGDELLCAAGVLPPQS